MSFNGDLPHGPGFADVIAPPLYFYRHGEGTERPVDSGVAKRAGEFITRLNGTQDSLGEVATSGATEPVAETPPPAPEQPLVTQG